MLQFHSIPNSVSGRGTVIALEEAEAEKRYVAPRTLPFVFFGRLVVFFSFFFFQMHFFALITNVSYIFGGWLYLLYCLMSISSFVLFVF